MLTHVRVEPRISETFGRITAGILLLVFFRKYFEWNSFGITVRGKKFFRGLWIGGYMLVATLCNLMSSLDEVSEFLFVMPSVYVVVTVVIEQLFVGIFEEFLVRGFVLNILLEKIRDKGFHGKMKAIAISSLLFGCMHFMNLFSEPQNILARACLPCFFRYIYRNYRYF